MGALERIRSQTKEISKKMELVRQKLTKRPIALSKVEASAKQKHIEHIYNVFLRTNLDSAMISHGQETNKKRMSLVRS